MLKLVRKSQLSRQRYQMNTYFVYLFFLISFCLVRSLSFFCARKGRVWGFLILALSSIKTHLIQLLNPPWLFLLGNGEALSPYSYLAITWWLLNSRSLAFGHLMWCGPYTCFSNTPTSGSCHIWCQLLMTFLCTQISLQLVCHLDYKIKLKKSIQPSLQPKGVFEAYISQEIST